MKIYVVIGSIGEYSDRTEAVICAVRSEKIAKELVVKLDAKSREQYFNPDGHCPDLMTHHYEETDLEE